MKRKGSNYENTMQQQVNNNNTRNWDDLPPEIIHRIHSLLYQGRRDDSATVIRTGFVSNACQLLYQVRRDSATVIRTGLVSKAWQHAWSISPTLVFFDSFLKSTTDVDIFANKVDDTLTRYDQQKLHIKSLLFYFYTSLSPHRLDSWLDKARRCGVQDIRLTGYRSSNKPVVLSTLFAIQTLQKLTLHEFKISFIDEKSSSSSVRCCSLKNLCLTKVDISEQTMKHILTCCPLVETLVVGYCSGFQEIHVTDLRSLGVFEFHVSIVAHQTINMTDSQAKFLTHLSLKNVQITDADFAIFSSKFQFLCSLSLEGCLLLERINIKFGLLTSLKLRPERIKAANIDAPNLRILDYKGTLEILMFTNVTPGQLEFGNLHVREGKNDTSWFLNLREVLRKFRQCKVVICYVGEEMSNHDVEHLRVKSSPALEENVTQLLLHMSPLLCADLAMGPDGTTTVDALFSICRPKYLFLGATFKQDHERFEFLLKKLATAAGITNQNCCMGQETKCWLHYLKDAKFRLLDKFDFEEHLEDQYDEAGWRSIGVAYTPSTRYKAVVIKLEWIGHSHSSSL